MEAESIQRHLERMTNQRSQPQSWSQDSTDLDALGVAATHMSQQYMQRNEVGAPKQQAVVMTKAQLEEQKMNEAQGYPSNLTEASKVQKLEQQMAQLSEGMSTLLSHMNGGIAQTSSPIPMPPPNPQSNVGLSYPTVSEVENGSPNSFAPKVVQRSDGSKMVVKPSFPTVGQTGGISVEDVEDVDEGDGSDSWATDPEVDPSLAVEEAQSVKVAALVTEVALLLRTKQPLKFFQSALSKAVGSRFLAYEAWPLAFRQQFDKQFNECLTDSVFLTKQVEKVLTFENGYAASPKRVAEMVVLTAGMIAYAFAGI